MIDILNIIVGACGIVSCIVASISFIYMAHHNRQEFVLNNRLLIHWSMTHAFIDKNYNGDKDKDKADCYIKLRNCGKSPCIVNVTNTNFKFIGTLTDIRLIPGDDRIIFISHSENESIATFEFDLEYVWEDAPSFVKNKEKQYDNHISLKKSDYFGNSFKHHIPDGKGIDAESLKMLQSIYLKLI